MVYREIINNSIIYYIVFKDVNFFKSNERMSWGKKRKKDVTDCEKSRRDVNNRLKSRISEWGNLITISNCKMS